MLFEEGFHCVDQAGLEIKEIHLLLSVSLLKAGIRGVGHYHLALRFLIYLNFSLRLLIYSNF